MHTFPCVVHQITPCTSVVSLFSWSSLVEWEVEEQKEADVSWIQCLAVHSTTYQVDHATYQPFESSSTFTHILYWTHSSVTTGISQVSL